MIIRKLFKFEAGHIVRNCSTEKCKWNLHGHSFIVEVFIRSSSLDNAGMIMDFGLMKPYISGLIDAFDHSYLIWTKESKETKESMKSLSRRWIELPVSPSAENLARIFHQFIERIISHTIFKNGEDNLSLKSVRVHETATGYAETEEDEYLLTELGAYGNLAVFSPEIMKDNPVLEKILRIIYDEKDEYFEMKAPEIQVKY